MFKNYITIYNYIILLNKLCVNERIIRQIRKYFKSNKNEKYISNCVGFQPKNQGKNLWNCQNRLSQKRKNLVLNGNLGEESWKEPVKRMSFPLRRRQRQKRKKWFTKGHLPLVRYSRIKELDVTTSEKGKESHP